MQREAFRDQVAIVTGASSGIGRALALQLAGQGAKVVLAARRAERLELVAEECRQAGGEVLIVPTDVSDDTQCKVLVEKTVAQFGCLDMLVNNAGLTVTALFEDFKNLELFRHVMGVNFNGAVNCTFYALPYLKQTHGRIVVVSSLGGIAAVPYTSAYCASKYALHGFFNSLRMEVSRYDVSVSVICPSWVVSEFHEAQLNRRGKPRGPSGRAIYTKRTMTSDQCAAIILRAAEKRRREVLMSPGRLATWLNVISPEFMDWFAVKVFLKSAIRRAKKNASRS
jgi:short-subunit dehydrogenase